MSSTRELPPLGGSNVKSTPLQRKSPENLKRNDNASDDDITEEDSIGGDTDEDDTEVFVTDC